MYYGINDQTVYDRLEYRQGRYVVEDLERELSRWERAALVLEKYRLLAGQKTLGFCVSIKHAVYMAEYFNSNGIPAACVHSRANGGSHHMPRVEALQALEEGRVKVVFAVDIFNEEVDIPSIDTVLFLRPTESFVVF